MPTYDAVLRKSLPGMDLPASTLGELLDSYYAATGFKIVPSEGPDYFVHDTERFGAIEVDLHIERDGQELCPGQDLLFPLLPNDLVFIAPMAC
ncbi:hypothetical protein [Tahibacter amnicola]|uniref:Uncharacterized protein n=1 Tax=Tahibacter amnicola TaxID=2976241 RepID=A0ABY6B9A4_9GAMM|nr:hypothetical protein [Tahibacter amnicola]UXI66589.1 hypothetical protein N4264_17780 [Tahibacter amnicola]